MKPNPDVGLSVFGLDLSRTGLICLLIASFFLCGCSIPKLEAADCEQARTPVRQFYSFHFANDMRLSADNLRARQKFLTPELFGDLSARAESPVDYFTATEDYPKAFRVGACSVSVPGRKVVFQVLLFWRTETRTEQREIRLEAEKIVDDWLINKVDEKQ